VTEVDVKLRRRDEAFVTEEDLTAVVARSAVFFVKRRS
jgi:hypothetical protein